MATRQRILFLLPAALISLLAGCGGAGTANVRNPPAPPVSTPSVAFQPAPAASILINTTTPLTAVVSNDPSNSGVDWSLTCQNNGNCGSLSPLHTASAQATTYTPPLTLPGNSETVTIVAFATADHTQNVAAAVSVTAFGGSLKGNYVLQANGIDSGFNPYQFAGVVALDGNGGIVPGAGEQTVNFFDPTVGFLVSKSDSVTGGSYFLGSDGRGTITINTNDVDIGPETFSFIFLSSAQALITAFPTSALQISGSGTMDLQTNTAAPSGGYAFVVSGTDFSSGSPAAMGGILNIDSLPNNPNNISGKGSLADQNIGGTLTLNQALSGTLSAPDPFGAVTLNLTVPNFPTPTFQFTGYIVDATHIKLIESDNSSGAGIGSTVGLAIGQGSATGTFKDDTSFSGTYVFGILGVDLTGITPATLTSVGVITADGSGNLTNGVTDTFLQQNGAQGTAGTQISATFAGLYSLDTRGTGRVRPVFSHFIPRPNPGFQPSLFFYLTGNGNPPLVFYGGDLSNNYPSLGTGIAYPQATGPLTFGGNYGFSFTQQNGGEGDGTGQMTATPTTGALSEIVDINSGFNPTFDSSFNDTFQAPLANGRFAGTLFNSAISVEYYIIDPSKGFFVETDLVNPGSGQVSFGYFAARTPVCAGCP